jgi:serine/threonine protein kinase
MRYGRAIATMARTLADRYELDQRIGRGAMGEVWAARDRETGAEVAVKVAQAWTAKEAELLERFEREGKVLRRLRSPHVCALLDAGRTPDGVSYIVLERLVGETLEELIDREGYLPLADVGTIAEQILLALVDAHAAGVVHRDLSPANVFLHRAPDGATTVKVIDFGVAKASGTGAPMTGKRTTMGSLPYVAPEQLGDSASAGPRADLYALGTLVFQALTGRMPFGDASGTALVVLKRESDPPSIDEVTGERWPAAMRTFLAKTLARSPSKRYPSAEVALAALREAVSGPGPRLEVPEKRRDATPTLDGPRSRRSK